MTSQELTLPSTACNTSLLYMQAFAKLSESQVTVKVREADQGLAKEAIESARSKYKDAFKKDGPTASVDTRNFLPAGPTGNEGEAESSW